MGRKAVPFAVGARLLLGVLGSLALVGTLAAQSASPIRIHVFTKADAAGFVDRDIKWWQEAVDDIKGLLGKKRRPLNLAVVDDPATADVTVEIAASSFNAWSGKSLRAVVMAGSYTKDFTAKQGMTRGAAGSLHTQLRRWLQDNTDAIARQRAPHPQAR